jgi:cytochrome c oxidase subunit 2
MPLPTLLYALLLALGCAAAAEAQDAESGQRLYGPCATCHGATGEGNQGVGAPRIAGLPEWYVAQQLRNFRARRRGAAETDVYGPQMVRAAEQLWDDGEVVDVAVFVASLPATASAATLRGKASRGREAYATCAACHGAAGEGNAELRVPPLRHLDDWYFVRQLAAFRAGERGAHADDSSGQQMRAALAAVDLAGDSALEDLAAHVRALADGALEPR